MTQEELIQIVKQINTVDLYGEAKDALTAKVLKLAADSVTLETLKALLSPRVDKSDVPARRRRNDFGKKVKTRLYSIQKGDQKHAGKISQHFCLCRQAHPLSLP